MEATQAALKEWFLVFLLCGSLVFLLGCAAFAVAVMRTRPLGGRLDGVVAGALVVFALARLVPIGAVQFYVQSAAALLALLPLAVGMWERTKTPGS
jgi:ABC-type multidrug transport system permease subunit